MEVIQFSHANGFPSPVYKQVLQVLREHYEVQTIARIGHNPNYRITDGWPALVDELITAIEDSGKQPVFGIGHSLGGVLTFYAAVQRPELFKGIILLDAPLMAPWRGFFLGIMKRLCLQHLVTPGTVTLNRRQDFASIEEALEHFRSKPVFLHFDPACLRDYITEGTVLSPAGRSLWFDVKVEAAIYATLPHRYRTWKKQLHVPGYFIYGKESTIVTSSDLRSIQRYTKLERVQVEGGHLFPFEKPKETVAVIVQALDALGKKT